MTIKNIFEKADSQTSVFPFLERSGDYGVFGDLREMGTVQGSVRGWLGVDTIGNECNGDEKDRKDAILGKDRYFFASVSLNVE